MVKKYSKSKPNPKHGRGKPGKGRGQRGGGAKKPRKGAVQKQGRGQVDRGDQAPPANKKTRKVAGAEVGKLVEAIGRAKSREAASKLFKKAGRHIQKNLKRRKAATIKANAAFMSRMFRGKTTGKRTLKGAAKKRGALRTLFKKAKPESVGKTRKRRGK